MDVVVVETGDDIFLESFGFVCFDDLNDILLSEDLTKPAAGGSLVLVFDSLVTFAGLSWDISDATVTSRSFSTGSLNLM